MAPTRKRSPESVDSEQSMVRCRTYGHAWDEFYPDDLGPPMFGWRLSLRCVRCATERHDTIDHIGQVGSRRYIYPDGYQTTRDEALTKEEYRQTLYASVRKQLAQAKAINEAFERAS